jgi:hypothetical protein
MIFTDFILFVLCYFNLFRRYLSKHDSKKEKKKLEAMTRSLARAVPTHQHTKTKFFFHHSNNTTSFIFKLVSLNFHNLNLQTFITSPKLHQTQQFLTQIIFKHKPTIKTNFHPPRSQIHQIRNP